MAQSRQIKKLDELMDGALTERFNLEMERVLNNVFDQNTNPKAKRQIQIVIDIVPNDRRDRGGCRRHSCDNGVERHHGDPDVHDGSSAGSDRAPLSESKTVSRRGTTGAGEGRCFTLQCFAIGPLIKI